MREQTRHRVFSEDLWTRVGGCGASIVAATIGIGIALAAMAALLLLLGVSGVAFAPSAPSSAGRDALAVLYAAQLVSLSFFNGTAELRFAAIPGLFLIGLSLAFAAALVARRVSGSGARRRRIALSASIPYALLLGTTALMFPLDFTAPGIGAEIAVSPSPAEAFLLPLGWGLLFASLGGVVGTFGRDWKLGARQLLGEWATPVACSARAVAWGLAASATIALACAFSGFGGHLESLTGGGHALRALGAALVVLPTVASAVLVSGFGVPFDWQVSALSHREGSISAFGGPLPSNSAHTANLHSAPGALALAPFVAVAIVFALGWMAARRSGADPRLAFLNALRAAAVTTIAVWLLAALGRFDAQVGGLLGFHVAPNPGALLWRVPLVVSLGCLAGALAFALTHGLARRQLTEHLLGAVRPRRWEWRQPEWVAQGLTWRAVLGVSFVSVPVLLMGLGATGPATSAAPQHASLAPIQEGAEERLERASTQDEAVAVTVNPETRVIDSANTHTPLGALGIAPEESRAAKARDVLERYGELFGLSRPGAELGSPETSEDRFGITHVSFQQTADGLPVFGTGIRVHLSHEGELLDFISGSLIPGVLVTEDKPRLSKRQAIEVADQALPSGRLAQAPQLQVYAGVEPYISGPNARIAWFVWLTSEKKHLSQEYVVDAMTGDILDTVPKTEYVKFREVYDWNEGPTLPGELIREEGEETPSGDAEVDAAYDNTGTVYDFYNGFEERDSWDGEGGEIVSTVHFKQASGATFNNAYWNGGQLVFGAGYPKALDIVGHEFTHAVAEHDIGLIGSGQSGALNESFGDIMGTTIEMEKEEAEEWEVGEDLPGGALRSLSEPSKYSEPVGPGGSTVAFPETLANWVETCLDNFGIHLNSTITSHAYYLAATKLKGSLNPREVAEIFYYGWTEHLGPSGTLEDARLDTLQAAEVMWGKESAVYEAVEEAFEEVGLNGAAQPTLPECREIVECSFARAMQTRQSASGESAAEMLTTLYKARGELALTTTAGDRFLPLYESHMVRITELVDQDPVLAELAVSGLEEITPALNGLIEGNGEQFQLTGEEMAKIEAALERLAEDDRLYGGEGAGELADLIDRELEWMGLASYAGMDYQSGFDRLNSEVKAQSLMEETGVIMDPNCTGRPYPNDFHVNGFYADTEGYDIPGQVAPFKAGGIICGAEVEAQTGQSGCVNEGSLNREVSVELPPGDKVNSTKNLTANSWVGELIGYGIACAGSETRLIYGQAGLLSLKSWTSEQCPTTAVACYQGSSTFETGEGAVTGSGYAWISEEAGALKLTTRPVTVNTKNGYTIKMSFGQFEVNLCGRAGSAASESCGGPTATWIHQNGEASGAGCPSSKGRYYMRAKNAAGESTIPVSTCVRWDEGAHMQIVDAPNSLNSVSCIPSSTTCVGADSKGNAYYATNVSASGSSTWNSWTGPGESPAEAVACPASTLCVLATGSVSGGGGNVYRASSLGGSFLSSFKPTNGVGALSCPSTSFCVSAHEGGGFIRYSTKPSGTSWTAVSIGTGAMKDVSCLSASFCAVVDGSGNVHVATSEAKIKEAGGWTSSSVNGGVALRSVACSSTSSCIAVDGSEKILRLTISLPGGSASASSQSLAGAGGLDDVTCTGETCVAVDDEGGIFSSTDSGSTWTRPFDAKANLKSVSCASVSLCAAVSSVGDFVKFDPTP